MYGFNFSREFVDCICLFDHRGLSGLLHHEVEHSSRRQASLPSYHHIHAPAWVLSLYNCHCHQYIICMVLIDQARLALELMSMIVLKSGSLSHIAHCNGIYNCILWVWPWDLAITEYPGIEATIEPSHPQEMSYCPYIPRCWHFINGFCFVSDQVWGHHWKWHDLDSLIACGRSSI